MERDRKYWFSKLYHVAMVGDAEVVMYVVSDLTNQELAKALAYWQEREDYEYCALLQAEAELRGITLKIKQ